MQAALPLAPVCVRISARRGVRGVLRVQAVPGALEHALVFAGIAVLVIVQGTVMDVADVLLRAEITVQGLVMDVVDAQLTVRIPVM